jgi:hypothetical protein
MAKHRREDEIQVSFTRKQLELIESVLDERRSWQPSRGTEFAAWRRVKRALGTWKEKAL